uniref:Uncharacterized protein n=1 Tax=Oryza punctata TaxID=4537 RepID=A0A0E0KQP9_ORYPU
MTLFKSKLANILIRWKTNTVQITTKSEQNDDVGDDSDCVEILSSTDNENKFTSKRHIDDSQESKPSCNQTKYQSLMSILSRMGVNELISGLCNYIKSIDCAQTLQKVWVQTSKPYTISLTIQKLQGILKEGEPMDHDCFNIINIVDFGRHPDYRKILNVQQLVESVCNGHDIDNNISKCKLDGSDLRKYFLAQLLAFQDNGCERNMPDGVRDLLKCIKNNGN